jgi:hypothetical protein
LNLFIELQYDDPLPVYYRRLRKIGATLSYDLEREQFFVYGVGGLPSWVVTACSNIRSRVIADLLRVEHGIEPTPEPETLAGGAVLHRLPPGSRGSRADSVPALSGLRRRHRCNKLQHGD